MEQQTCLPFPFEFKKMERDHHELMQSYNHNSVNLELMRVGPKGYVVCKPFMKEAENIYNMPLRPSDVFVTSFQRSGTTVTQELVWLLINNLDYDNAAATLLVKRYAFLEAFMFFDNDNDRKDTIIKTFSDEATNIDKEQLRNRLETMAIPASRNLATATSPRFVKTHLPLSLLPHKLLDTGKVFYVARDPRDVAVSCYYHTKLFKTMHFPGGFKEFWNIFYKSLYFLTPYFDHVKEAWEKRHHPNMLFLFYEDLSKDLPAAVRRVANHLSKPVDEEQIIRLCDHISIDSFRKNSSLNYEHLRGLGALADGETFIRRGKAGGWRDYFDEEMTQQAERWIADNLRDTDLRFPHMEN